jgi:hypothetical protein
VQLPGLLRRTAYEILAHEKLAPMFSYVLQFPVSIDRLDYKPGMVVDPRRLWLERLGTSSDRQYKQADAQTNQSELQQ